MTLICTRFWVRVLYLPSLPSRDTASELSMGHCPDRSLTHPSIPPNSPAYRIPPSSSCNDHRHTFPVTTCLFLIHCSRVFSHIHVTRVAFDWRLTPVAFCLVISPAQTLCSQAFALVTNHPKKAKKEMGRYLMCLFTTALRRTRKQHGI